MGYGQYSYNTFQPQKHASAAYARNPDGTIGKRVKRVQDTRQTIHTWAARSQTNGENGKGNVYFIGDRLFDYGDHFCLGQFVTTKKGELVCLLNSDSYGPTTSHHQGVTAGAIPKSIPTFTIPKAGYERYTDSFDVDKTLVSYKERATTLATKAKRAKKQDSKDWYNVQAANVLEEAKTFAKTFGARFRVASLDALAKAAIEAAKRVEKERKEREAHERAIALEDFKAWQAGTKSHCPYAHNRTANGGAYLRVSNDGQVLQSSQGAEVPMSHAIRAFKFIKLCRDGGKAWAKNGHSLRVGNFAVDSVSESGDIHAGCHFIEWAEIERIAKQIGVFDVQADDAALSPSKEVA